MKKDETLEKEGHLYKTNNKLNWYYGGGGAWCCSWKYFPAYNCFVHRITVYKRHHAESMESTAGNVAHCDYRDSVCRLADGRMLQWEVDERETCEFIPWKAFEGRRQGNEFLEETWQLALT